MQGKIANFDTKGDRNDERGKKRDQFFFYSTEYTKFWIDQRIIFIGNKVGTKTEG